MAYIRSSHSGSKDIQTVPPFPCGKLVHALAECYWEFSSLWHARYCWCMLMSFGNTAQMVAIRNGQKERLHIVLVLVHGVHESRHIHNILVMHVSYYLIFWHPQCSDTHSFRCVLGWLEISTTNTFGQPPTHSRISIGACVYVQVFGICSVDS